MNPSHIAAGPTRRGVVCATALSALALASSRGARAAAPQAWRHVDPANQGVASSALEAALADGDGIAGLRAVTVARDGLLVGERYYAGTRAGQLQPINSATKSVSSMLVGIALQRGKLRSLSQTVAQLLPEDVARAPGSAAAALTLHQILTGTTGLAYDFQRQFPTLLAAREPIPYVLGLPHDGQPAGTWSYNDAAVSLLAPILERAYGLPLAHIARVELFAPLGIAEFRWGRDASGRATSYHGLALAPRDLLKLAWTMCDAGAWDGTQVVPPGWAAESTRPATPGAWRLAPIADSRYACLWFTGTLAGRPVAWAWGYGGQFALFVPSLRVAVATAATSPPPRDLVAQTVAISTLVSRVVAAAAAA